MVKAGALAFSNLNFYDQEVIGQINKNVAITKFFMERENVIYILLYEMAIALNIYSIYAFWETDTIKWGGIILLICFLLVASYFTFIKERWKFRYKNHQIN